MLNDLKAGRASAGVKMVIFFLATTVALISGLLAAFFLIIAFLDDIDTAGRVAAGVGAFMAIVTAGVAIFTATPILMRKAPTQSDETETV